MMPSISACFRALLFPRPAHLLTRATSVMAAMAFAASALAQPLNAGSRMDQVRDARGEPLAIEGPVGEPPITRWRYPEHNLYFEHDQLITSVPADNRPRLERTDGLRPRG
ncbi:MAG: hypothetical protein ABF296_07175 [Oceanococcaceae bacterium]